MTENFTERFVNHRNVRLAAKAMSTLSEKRLTISQRHDSKWDDAIHDAEQEIGLLVRQKARPEQAIRIFRANKRDGVSWPEEK